MHPSRKLNSSNHPSQETGWSEVVEVHWCLLCEGLNNFHYDEAFICAFNRLSNINMHLISSTSPRLTYRKKKKATSRHLWLHPPTSCYWQTCIHPSLTPSYLKINVLCSHSHDDKETFLRRCIPVCAYDYPE